jgi:choline dehydrogenase-like flavoprotein
VLIDARELPDGHLVQADLCILGAGAAGITLAKELIGSALEVALIESGGFELDADTQALYRGELVGHPNHPLDASRLRYFGGTTNHWGGTCRPLDAIDFEQRAWVPHSGWPFDREHLDPFYARAQTLCELGPYAYEAAHWQSEEFPTLPLAGERLTTAVFQQSPPTRFGQVYRDEIVRASNVTVYTHANLLGYDTNEGASEVVRARLGTLSGRRHAVAATTYILAAGGIENARLLLLSGTEQQPGLGNAHDLVGRYFMDHLGMQSAVIMLSDPELRLGLYRARRQAPDTMIEGTGIKAFLTPTPELQRREQILNCAARPRETKWQEATPGARALNGVLGDLRRGHWPDDLTVHIGAIMQDIDELARVAYARLRGETPPAFRINYWMEQTPNPDSRVTLAEERDAFNLRRVRLDWRFTEQELRTTLRMQQLLAEELGRAGIGRLRLDEALADGAWPAEASGSFHHMGTTRMHEDPKQGVVDAHCRVHGVANLYVAGSSVFPTSGHANPTLTIVALAVRLADHLKELARTAERGSSTQADRLARAELDMVS